MSEIIGLPAIVTPRNRIVIDKSLRHFFGIPESGSVQLLINRDQLQIFPITMSVKGAVTKEISIGRFNLPAEWARSNRVNDGDYVFLIATDDCILVRPSVKNPIFQKGKE